MILSMKWCSPGGKGEEGEFLGRDNQLRCFLPHVFGTNQVRDDLSDWQAQASPSVQGNTNQRLRAVPIDCAGSTVIESARNRVNEQNHRHVKGKKTALESLRSPHFPMGQTAR